jgi:hypothetical protein
MSDQRQGRTDPKNYVGFVDEIVLVSDADSNRVLALGFLED